MTSLITFNNQLFCNNKIIFNNIQIYFSSLITKNANLGYKPIWVNAVPSNRGFVAWVTFHEITHRVSSFAGLDGEAHDARVGLLADGPTMNAQNIKEKSMGTMITLNYFRLSSNARRIAIFRFLRSMNN